MGAVVIEIIDDGRERSLPNGTEIIKIGSACFAIYERDPKAVSAMSQIDWEYDRRVRIRQNPEPLARQKNPPSWALDRIDERDNEKSQEYTYPESAGEGVWIYVIDTGVDINHREFLWTDSCRRRARWGVSFIGDSTDRNGHGTFVAGVAAGLTVGVAKQAWIVAVQVLDSQGEGSISDILRGIEWTVNDINQSGLAKGKAVVNLSFGAPRSSSMNRAVNAMADQGIPVIVAAGNDDTSACLFSPASADSVITVGASNQDDRPAKFTNTGVCLNLFAPGEEITSAAISGSSSNREECPDAEGGYKTEDGTSFAAPVVSGIVAIYQGHELRNQVDHSSMKPSDYRKYITKMVEDQATRNKLRLGFFARSPNRLAYVFPPGMGQPN